MVWVVCVWLVWGAWPTYQDGEEPHDAVWGGGRGGETRRGGEQTGRAVTAGRAALTTCGWAGWGVWVSVDAGGGCPKLVAWKSPIAPIGDWREPPVQRFPPPPPPPHHTPPRPPRQRHHFARQLQHPPLPLPPGVRRPHSRLPPSFPTGPVHSFIRSPPQAVFRLPTTAHAAARHHDHGL